MSAAAAATTTATTAAAAVAGSEFSLASLQADTLDFLSFNWLSESYIANWRFVVGRTWLSTWWVPLVTVPLYLGTIKGLQWWVKKRGKPYNLHWAVVIHNCYLSIGSAVLFFAMASELLQMYAKSSAWDVFCDGKSQFWHGRIYFLYYLNYMFKFVELLDTVLLALRGKPTEFLHVYHHSATLILCWSQLRAQSCMQWVVIVINLYVHIIMYMYYALHALGIHVWWKKYLTVTQIVQFVIALVGCFAALIPRSLNQLGWHEFPHCHGEFPGAFFGIGLLLSYLLLFIKLYFESYLKPGGKHAKSAGKGGKGDKPAAAAADASNGSSTDSTDATDSQQKPKQS